MDDGFRGGNILRRRKAERDVYHLPPRVTKESTSTDTCTVCPQERLPAINPLMFEDLAAVGWAREI